jgi:hypothetical protein
MLDAITGIADAKAEAPPSKPADFSKVRRVNSAKPIFDAFIWDCRLSIAKPSNRCANIRDRSTSYPSGIQNAFAQAGGAATVPGQTRRRIAAPAWQEASTEWQVVVTIAAIQAPGRARLEAQ